MPRVSTYLNFMGNAEEAFEYYGKVFGTELLGPITRMSEMTAPDSLPEGERNLVGHAELPILAGHILMASDMLESMGHALRIGNNVTVNLEHEDRAEIDRLFGMLSEGGSDAMGMMEMPWGAYWGTCADRFGIRWMFNCPDNPSF